MESMPMCKLLVVLNPKEKTNVDALLKLIYIEDSESKRVSVFIKNEDIYFYKLAPFILSEYSIDSAALTPLKRFLKHLILGSYKKPFYTI